VKTNRRDALTLARLIGLAHTNFAEPTYGTIRLNLLKLGARVRANVWRIKFAMASAYPWQDNFTLAHLRLRIAAA
jgi:DDE family transposase